MQHQRESREKREQKGRDRGTEEGEKRNRSEERILKSIFFIFSRQMSI